MRPLVQKSVAFHTLGCKLNFAETSTISRQLHEAGFSPTRFDARADMYVINTCSVTDNADRKCRSAIRKALSQNPDAFIVVVGCYAQLKPEEIASIPGVDLVLGASEKFRMVQYLDHLAKRQSGVYHSCDIDTVDTYQGGYSLGERTRAFLKVQDGCDYSCTFCTIPLARGRSRSSSVSDVVVQANELVGKGVKEIVLTGVNTGDFGKGLQGGKIREETFLELITALDRDTDAPRIRISSIEPNLLSDDIIAFVSQSKRFMPHFHIPLQSGSDAVLKQMKRRYLTPLYTNRVQLIRELMPHAAIGVDVIVGFPGETEALFAETCFYLTNLSVSYLHVFTYSERPDTEAILLDGVVPIPERHERSMQLRQLSDKLRADFYRRHLGGTRDVLFEGKPKEGLFTGYTDNYIAVQHEAGVGMANQIVPVYLDTLGYDQMVKGLLIREGVLMRG